MRSNRLKVSGVGASYHCMSRTVNGEHLFGNREKEVLRKMIWQVADFSGVRVLTYCVMANHFHVLIEVPVLGELSDRELLRRYQVLYPKPTKYQELSIRALEAQLAAGGEEAEVVRRRLMARMSDISEFMKTLNQRFSVWFNKSHNRFGTLWADRFKSVLVEGKGNPLQTMAAYIDLNSVRAGLVEDPKDYRFCGYAEAVVGAGLAAEGLLRVWQDYIGAGDFTDALAAHRTLIFGKGAAPREAHARVIDRKQVVEVIEMQNGVLPRSSVLRCRVRYFTEGVLLGSADYVSRFVDVVKHERKRTHPPKVHPLRGALWGDVTVIQNLRSKIFS